MANGKSVIDIGDIIPSNFNPAIVTASYFASLCGCLLTVELLHRRSTGFQNLRSWLETIACATSLGAIGIWCMHFIGNRAIILGDGTPAIQLVYSPGYSALSVFLPIIGLIIAFTVAEHPSTSAIFHQIALTCTGVFAGLSIVGMHYIGNFGISNYKLEYVPRFLAASIVIAIGDCLLVLTLFYTWRDKWISDWWKRLLCAIILAGGVSAMHFTASTNCIYRLKHYNTPHAIHSRDIQVIVAGVLCGTAGMIVLCVLFFTRHRSRVLKRSSQKVMLACAMFDPDGRILVTTEGVLPSREITDKYNHRTFNEEFDTAHPVFQWIFRTTRNWAGVADLIPKMKSHLTARKDQPEDLSRPNSASSSASYDPQTYSDYSIIFRERFCIAAASLASSMSIPVERIGVLYDNILETGTLKPEDKRSTLMTLTNQPDVEMGRRHSLFGKGQLMFLTRHLTADDADKMLNTGFKLASLQYVSRNIAETMQIPLAALEVHMSSLRHYIDNLSTLEKVGTWLTCFTMIPKANSKGFDVAVKNTEQDQLPDVQLLPFEPLPWHANFLSRMHDMPSNACLTFLEDRQRRDTVRTPQEHQFALVIVQTMKRLSMQMPSLWFQSARFYGQPVYAHYSQPLRSKAPVTTMYTFVVCADLHTSIEALGEVTRVPMSFFDVRQQCYAGSPNHSVLTHEIHQEFGPLLARKTAKSTKSRVNRISVRRPKLGRRLTKSQSRQTSIAHSGSEQSETDFSSDTYELVDKPRNCSDDTQDTRTGPEREEAWGGILVNSETVIKSASKSEFSTHARTTELGMRTAVGTAKPEETFVDELFAFARGNLSSKTGH